MSPFSSHGTTVFSNSCAHISWNSQKSFNFYINESQPTFIPIAVSICHSYQHCLNRTTKRCFEMKLHVKRKVGCNLICFSSAWKWQGRTLCQDQDTFLCALCQLFMASRASQCPALLAQHCCGAQISVGSQKTTCQLSSWQTGLTIVTLRNRQKSLSKQNKSIDLIVCSLLSGIICSSVCLQSKANLWLQTPLQTTGRNRSRESFSLITEHLLVLFVQFLMFTFVSKRVGICVFKNQGCFRFSDTNR